MSGTLTKVKSEHTNDKLEHRTRMKFIRWDAYVSRNYLEGTDEERDKAYALLSDPTIYLYAFFRTRNGKPLRLYSYQDHVINDRNKRVVFVAANQIGKSITLVAKACTFALMNP